MNEPHLFRQRGQTLILVAVAFVALLLFVAVAVDMSNAYAHRRTAQNAADAAALGAAQELGRQINGHYEDDTAIKRELNKFAERNGIADTDGIPGNEVNDNIVGYYVDANGERIGEQPIGSVGDVPDHALGVEATAHIQAPTFFGGIVGLSGLPLRAEAAVQFQAACSSGDCVLPIAVHAMGFQGGNPSQGIPGFVEGQCYNLWDGEGPGNFGWLNWSTKGFSCPGEIGDDCSADCLVYNLNPDFCTRHGELMINVGDLIGGTTGVKNANQVRNWLKYYIDNEIVALMVVYDQIVNPGGCGKVVNGVPHGQMYRVAGMGAFQITGYRLSSGKGKAVVYDTHGVDPTTCLDFPPCYRRCDENGENCVPCEPGTEGCIACNWIETGEMNRITGIARPYTGGDAGNCHAVGNLLAPRLSK